MPHKVPDRPILLVDDEEDACRYYRTALETACINNFISCNDSRKVMSLLSEQEAGLIILDVMMPHLSGEELLSQITCDFPDIPVIMLTAIDEVKTAVNCMREGAFDYIVKPVDNDRLVSAIKRAFEMRALREANSSLCRHFLSKELDHPEVFSELVTNDADMLMIFQYIESIAKTSRPVMVTGETGVGKELIANTIHKVSGRKGAFVTVNVGGLDDNVFSDTLFGHRKGAYTGADNARSGLVEKAAGGTLFLDEIGDMDPASQVKLLRLLQSGEYYPLGSDSPKYADIRILVATNSDMKKLKEEGKIRKDLYFRLGDHYIEIPPLRNRLEDLPILLDYFIEKTAESLGKVKPEIPDSLLNLLSGYKFPGNIRELQGMIFDALSQNNGAVLSLVSFKEAIARGGGNPCNGNVSIANYDIDSEGTPPLDLKKIFRDRFPPIHEVETLLIKEAMRCANGNQSEAAKMLGMSRPTLNKRLKRLSDAPRLQGGASE